MYEFELSDDTKRTVAKGTLPLASIIATLKENGFDVGSKRDLLGKSGATHTFDIVAKKEGVLVVGNFAFEPKEEDIIGLFAKKYDVDPTFTILIALTTPTKDEETVSKAYGVKIVSPMGSHTIGKQIVELVDSQLQQAKPEEMKIESKAESNIFPEPVIELKQGKEDTPKEPEQELLETLKSSKLKEQKQKATEDSEEARRTAEGDKDSDVEKSPDASDETSAEHHHADWDSESF